MLLVRGRFMGGVLKGSLLSAILALCGCGSLNEVGGTVSYKGKKLTMGKITFVAADGKKTGFTNIAADGSYKLVEPPLGQVKIGVEVKPPPNIAEGKQATKATIEDAAHPKLEPVTIPAAYADPGKSGLSKELKTGKNTFDIELK